jgi:hypothetical protein
MATQLVAWMVHPGASLLVDAQTTSSWMTQTRPVGAKLHLLSTDNWNEQFHAIFEVTKLARRYYDPTGLFGSDEATTAFCSLDTARKKYHLVLDLTMAEYNAFAERVSHGKQPSLSPP